MEVKAESQLKHFTKKLTVLSLSFADNPLQWRNSAQFSRDKNLLYGEKKIAPVR